MDQNPAVEDQPQMGEINMEQEMPQAGHEDHQMVQPEQDDPPMVNGEGWPEYCNPAYKMPNLIEVKVVIEETGEERYIPVAIERAEYRKKYLGGYRHKKTGAVFHHAQSQTEISTGKKAPKDTSNLFSRDTQTAQFLTRGQQTKREAGTQMARHDLHLDAARDRELRAQEYFGSEELLNLQKQHAVVLQRFWRGYLARRRAWGLRRAFHERAAAARRAQEAKALAAEAAARREVRRRMDPRSAADFEVLYNELERWRAAEAKRVRAAGLGPADRQRAHQALLHKETRLLQTIDRLKATAAKEGRAERVQRMLDLLAMPKKWELSDGEVTEVHTPFTTRAAELRELYRGLTAPLLGVDERLDVLLHVKWTVKEFDCPLTRDIVELVDREADLLNRGRGEKALEGLRRRVANLFLRFVETPEFNPEAARFLKIPPPPNQQPELEYDDGSSAGPALMSKTMPPQFPENNNQRHLSEEVVEGMAGDYNPSLTH